MTLTTRVLMAPDLWPRSAHYDQRAEILPADRCGACDGIGLIKELTLYPRRLRAHPRNLWHTCFECGGDGRKGN
jgi:hypothetical protein